MLCCSRDTTRPPPPIQKMSPSPVDRRRFGARSAHDKYRPAIDRSHSTGRAGAGREPELFAVSERASCPAARRFSLSEKERSARHRHPPRAGRARAAGGVSGAAATAGWLCSGAKLWICLLISAVTCGALVAFFARHPEVRRASRSRKGNAPRRAASSQRARIFLGVRASCDVTVASTRKVGSSGGRKSDYY